MDAVLQAAAPTDPAQRDAFLRDIASSPRDRARISASASDGDHHDPASSRCWSSQLNGLRHIITATRCDPSTMRLSAFEAEADIPPQGRDSRFWTQAV